MKGFVQDIESLAVKNSNFRQVLYTAKHCQLVVMALKAREEVARKYTSSTSFFVLKKDRARRFSMVFGRRSARDLR